MPLHRYLNASATSYYTDKLPHPISDRRIYLTLRTGWGLRLALMAAGSMTGLSRISLIVLSHTSLMFSTWLTAAQLGNSSHLMRYAVLYQAMTKQCSKCLRWYRDAVIAGDSDHVSWKRLFHADLGNKTEINCVETNTNHKTHLKKHINKSGPKNKRHKLEIMLKPKDGNLIDRSSKNLDINLAHI